MFDKMKQVFEMQKKMQEIKRALDSMNFDIQSPDNLVKITMNGSQEVKAIVINESFKESDKTRFESLLKDTFNRAIKRSQEEAARRMKDITGLNLPGLV